MAVSSSVPASRWLRFWWPFVLGGVLVLALVSFVGLSWWIQIGARETGDRAMKEFPGDRVEALIAFVKSDRHSLDEKNHAVWALGQLRDRRAVPVLEKYYTGEPCDHARFLCQVELRKAIDLCKGEGVSGLITRALKLP